MSVDNTPIIVSAPPGGLGRHLAALIDYAVNAQAETPNFNRRISGDVAVADFVSPTTQALSPLQFWDWDYDLQGRIPVYYTAQSPSDIAKDYPNGRIIQVTTTQDDAIQLGYNYIVIEQWRGTGSINEQFHTSNVNRILGEDLIWTDIFPDPQFIDNPAVQLLISSVASSRTTSPTAPAPRADLVVEFQNICCPANTAGNTDITPVLEFLGKTQRDNSELSQIWYAFVRSLHHAKRNILNTANWS